MSGRLHRTARCGRPRLHPWLAGLTLLFACAEPDEVPARAPLVGELLISQLYTSGAVPAGGTDHYFSDQFIELVNAAEVPLDLSGVRVADVHGAAGEINPGMSPDSFRESRPDEVVMSSVWRLPEGASTAGNVATPRIARRIIGRAGVNPSRVESSA